MGACLSDDTLAAVLDGALAEDAARHAREHLGTCDACRRLVSAVVENGTRGAHSATTIDRTVFEMVVPGSLIGGKYQVERLVGTGGMGQVFRARQLELGRSVALKVLRPGLARHPLALARFAREARLASGLISESVVRIHDVGQLASGEPYLVMELLTGEDLGAVVARGAVSADRAASWLLAACSAIGEAHALGIVHRDLKPANLFLAQGPGGERLKVLDFGLAKLAAGETGGAAQTADGHTVGSPRYMSPEQITGASPVDARSDVWALGATLHHLLAGAVPFDGETLHAVFANIRDRPAPSLLALRPDVSATLAAVVSRCLSKNPAARFANALELAAALRVSGAAAPSLWPAARYELPGAPPPRAPARASSGSGVIIGVAVALFVAIAMAGTVAAVLVSRGVGAPALPAGGGPSLSPALDKGLLTSLDETRLRSRLERRGIKVGNVTRQDFGTGCRFVQLDVTQGKQGGYQVYLSDCSSPVLAGSEATRLRRSPTSWTIVEGTRVLHCALADEVSSRDVCNAVTDLAPDAGAR